jgi:hypothetical protein
VRRVPALVVDGSVLDGPDAIERAARACAPVSRGAIE